MKVSSYVRALIIALPLCLAPTGCNNDDREGDGVLKPPLDTQDGDADTNPPPDTVIVKGEPGDPCAQDDDCASDLCANASGTGRICTETCADGTCPSGLVCVSDGEQSLCVKADVVNCQPCSDNAGCNVAGLTGNTCVDYGDAGSFCGQACTGAGQGDCPTGYTCDGGACKKADLACECNAVGIALEAQTTCSVSNDFGSCEGTRGCGAGGLSRCYAETPAAETCNGGDDDCDGDTDEGTGGAECELTNEFGTCIGVVECTVGRPLCVGQAPAAEICNGKDDNCNGQTDEGSDDVDDDDIADCVDPDWDNDGSLNPDDCQPRNPDVHPGASDVCNGIDDDCTRIADDGEAAGCGCYVCGGAAGCLTACDSDADVDDGFVCDLEDFDGDENTSECLPSDCGNGEVEAREVCDDGENVGGYNGCFACQERGPYCGDGKRDFEFEVCDDGPELNGTPNHCNLTCSGPTPPECNNGVLEQGEECDLGDANSNAPNAECRTDCTPRRCGDGVVDSLGEEACDAGNANGATTCGCQPGCFFADAETLCRPAVQGALCDVPEFCNGQGACPAESHLSGVTCRAATGPCDVAETCSGASGQCPADGVAGNTVVCRPIDGDCDVADTCDGTNKACPALDRFAPSTQTCRGPAGACDQEEKCTGESADCPDDTLFGFGTPCRESVGGCDLTEFCDGNTTACPDDLLEQNGTICHESMGGCDPWVACDGTSGECAYDGVFGAGTVCREAGGACDSADLCDGVSPECDETGFDDNTTVCRESAGACDPAETCTGFGAECPDDSLFGFGTLCREAAGDCDVPEFCEGNTTACPTDLLFGQETLCHGAEGACDTNVTCDGTNPSCGWTGYIGAGTVCRPGNDECDLEETCTGDSGACPDDLLADNTTVCRGAAGVCDEPELCTGFSRFCGIDVLKVEELCRAGGDTCNPAEWCNGQSVDCPGDFVEEDGVDCTQTADCTDGPCACDTGVCTPSCGNGTLEGAELCDDGELNGTRDHCNLWCSAPCGLEAGWARNGGGFENDQAYAVAVDADAVAFDVGFYSAGQLNLDGAPAAPTFGSAQFGEDLFFARYQREMYVQATGSDNLPVWAACASGFGDDVANGVATDETSVWVVGAFDGNVTFGCCEFALPSAAGIGPGGCPWVDSGGVQDSSSEAFVARYDRLTGTLLWATGGGQPYNHDEAYDVAAMPKGGAVMVGEARGAEGAMQVTYGGRTAPLFGFYDAVVVGYDANGGTRWLHTFGGSGEDWAWRVVLDGEGNAYVVGSFTGSVTFGDVVLQTAAADASEVFVARIAADGTVDWAVSLGSILTSGAAYPNDITYGCVASDAGPACTVYVAAVDFELGDQMLALLDPDDGTIVDSGFLGLDAVNINALTVDRSGALTLAGELWATTSFGDFTLEKALDESTDGFLARLDATGAWRWAKRIGGDGNDRANGVAAGPGGNVWVAGEFAEVAAFDDIALETWSFREFGREGFDSDTFVAKYAPSFDGCFECGDGVVDAGESCDDDDTSSCTGTCDDLCQGAANACGDGWAECGEDYDLGGGSADQGMCTMVAGNAWCFEIADNDPTTGNNFTLLPVRPGEPAVLGPGVLRENWNVPDTINPLPINGLAGNPNQLDVCPQTRADGTEVNHQSLSSKAWGGDVPTPDADGETDRLFCDGVLGDASPPTVSPPTFALGGNTLGAAIECGDFYEFIASTDEVVAFEFDERAGNQGPTQWALYVSLSGTAGTWSYAGRGTTFQAGDYGNGIMPPLHSFELSDFVAIEGPVALQPEVHFRLYGWGSNAPSDPWTLDNVRVGAPTRVEPFRELFCFEETEANAYSTNVTLDRGVLSVFNYGTGVTKANSGGNTRAVGCAPLNVATSSQAASGSNWPLAATPGIDATKYYEFVFDSPAATLELTFDIRRSSSGPTLMTVTSSEAGTVADGVATPATDTVFNTYTYTINGTGSGAHAIRIYGHSAGQTGGTMRIDNVSLRELPAIVP